VIDGLRDQGVFAPVMLPPQPVVPAPDPDYDPAQLEADQLAAAANAARDVWPGRLRRDAA
jgi:primosomal protein N' (replication factor Y)